MHAMLMYGDISGSVAAHKHIIFPEQIPANESNLPSVFSLEPHTSHNSIIDLIHMDYYAKMPLRYAMSIGHWTALHNACAIYRMVVMNIDKLH